MAFITVDGEQLIAKKVGAKQTLVITEFVFANIAGLGAEPANRVEAMPAAAKIVDSAPVSRQGYVNENQVVFSVTLDSTVGDYDFNWVGLKADDGTLVACEHIPLTQKRKTSGSTPGNNLTRNFLLAFSGAQGTTAINVPAETWQIDFTTRLLQIDERERLSNFDEYGHDAFFGNGFLVSLVSGTTYRIAAGVAYVGGVRAQIAAKNLNVGSVPTDIYLDASLQGDINGVSPVIVLSASATALADNTDALGFKHFLCKIASISAAGAITDLRVPVNVSLAEAQEGTVTANRRWSPLRVAQAIAKRIADHEADPNPHPGYDAPDVTQAEAEAGTVTANRRWSPLRVAQAIAKRLSAHEAASNPHPNYQFFSRGDRLLFPMATAPIGWAQVTDPAINNRFLRVVNATGAGMSGSDDPTVMNVVPSHTHVFSTSGFTATDGSHAHGFVGSPSITDSENQQHSHSINPPQITTSKDGQHSHTHRDYGMNMPGNGDHGDGGQGGFATRTTDPAGEHSHTIDIGPFNSGTQSAAHNHDFTAVGSVTATPGTLHRHAFSINDSTDANASGRAWRPRYLDLILCEFSG